ncbi:MAG: hypothetical protein Q9218_000831 [Villophora microphyllina]
MSGSSPLEDSNPQITVRGEQQDEFLSFDQMKQMLRTAEQRMKGLSSPKTQPSTPGASFTRAVPYPLPKLDRPLTTELYLTTRLGLTQVEPRKVTYEKDKGTTHKERKTSAGSDWFHLPRTKLTPEVKRDLQMLKMRSTWDPKRHYKSDNRKPLIPHYSQIGTILEGPTEFYSSRIAKRDRKRTFVDEVLAAENHTRRFGSNYNDIQYSKTSGRRGFYKSLKRKRSRP